MAKAFNLKNGTLLLSTEAPGGIYNAAQLKKIASLCDGDMAIVKATEDQRLALFVKEDQAEIIAEELRTIGLGIRNYQDGLHQPVACIGELCPDHELDALGSAMDLTSALAEVSLASPLKIGINGCARCCVPCHTLDISIIADSGGYRISLGGKSSQLPEMGTFMAERIPVDKIVDLTKKVVQFYAEMANFDDHETLQDVIDRCGAAGFIEILAPYSQDAADDDDPFGSDAEELSESAGDDADGGEDDSPEMDAIDVNDSGDDLGDLVEEGDVIADDLEAGDDFDMNEGDDELDMSMDDEMSQEQEADSVSSGGTGNDIVADDDDGIGLEDEVTVIDSDLEDADLESDVPIDEPHDSLGDMEDVSTDGLALSDDDNGFDDDVALEEESFSEAELDEVSLKDDEEEVSSELDAIDEEDSMAEELTDSDEGLSDDFEEEGEISEIENEGEFESLLTKGIEEDEEFRAQEDIDENSNDREIAFEKLDSAEDGDLGDDLEEETLQGDELGDDFDDGKMDQIEDDLGEDLQEESLREELVDQAELDPAPATSPVQSKQATHAMPSSPGDFGFAGVDFTDDGQICLRFDSGAFVSVPVNSVSSGRVLNFGGNNITLSKVAGGITVQVDGIEFFVPTGIKAA